MSDETNDKRAGAYLPNGERYRIKLGRNPGGRARKIRPIDPQITRFKLGRGSGNLIIVAAQGDEGAAHAQGPDSGGGAGDGEG